MRARTAAALVAAAVLVVSGCGGDGDDDDAGTLPDDAAREALAPDFGSTSTTAAAGGAPTTLIIGGTDAVSDDVVSTTSTSAPLPAAEDPPLEAAVNDHPGDTYGSTAGAPAWADLLGARITRSRQGYELRVRLAGGSAPERSPDENTMNIASFFDLDDDGDIEYEIWANLGPDGWGASYYENEAELAYHGAQSFVEVAPQGDEVVISFALLHLDRAAAFRWSIASEWGPYVSIGTDSMTRDQAPDAGASAAFPKA